MAGRRLSSNDVSVVIALAIVVLVLLLIFIVERGAGRPDGSDTVAAVGARVDARESAASTPSAASSLDAPGASRSDPCTPATLQRLPGQTDDELVARQRDEAVRSILAVLDTHPEPRARAAGLYFRATRDRFESSVAEVCKSRPDACSDSEQQHRDDGGSAEALARLAADSADPQVYAWAYRSCAAVAHETAKSCQLISAPQWARLDPGNAEPWLAVAREARSRRDAAGLDDAMFHVAAASVHDSGWGRLAEELVRFAPQEDRLVVGTWLASADAVSYETLDLAVPDTSRYCEARAIANANRRDTCDKIATVLVEHSTTLMGRAVGISLGKRLDWPPGRFATVDEEGNAARAVESREALLSTEPLSCGGLRRELSRLVEVGRLGEIEALRRRVASTGEPIAALAEEGRQLAHRAEEAEAVRAAASAAKTAAAAEPSSSALPQGR
jgi:hypothetical protein